MFHETRTEIVFLCFLYMLTAFTGAFCCSAGQPRSWLFLQPCSVFKEGRIKHLYQVVRQLKENEWKEKTFVSLQKQPQPKLTKGDLPVLSVNYGQLKGTKSKKLNKVVLSSLSLLIEPYSTIFSSVTGGPRWHQRRQKTRFSFTSPYVIYCYPAIPQPDPLGRAPSLLSD